MTSLADPVAGMVHVSSCQDLEPTNVCAVLQESVVITRCSEAERRGNSSAAARQRTTAADGETELANSASDLRCLRRRCGMSPV